MNEAGANLISAELRTLIVDDDLAFLELLDGMLKGLGIKTVERADSGVNAYTFLAGLKDRWDCIICDLNMTNGNGLQLLREVRLGTFKYVRPDACFIMVTAIKHPLAVKTSAQLDVHGYVAKPVTAETLKAALIKARGYFFPVDFNKYRAVQVPST